MGYYRKIDSRIQNDRKFRSLSRDARLVWYDIFTHPSLNNFGAMRTTMIGLAAEWGEDHKTFQKAFEENISKGLIKFSDMLLWFPNYLKYNPPASANVVKSWPKLLDTLPECDLKNECIQSLSSFCNDNGFEIPKDLTKGLTKDLNEGLTEDPLILLSISLNKEVKEEGSGEKPLETIPYQEIISYLNEKAGKDFRLTAPAKGHIHARWSEGATLADFKHVIDIKCADWKGTQQEQYLRPQTLFNSEKFESYRNQKEPASELPKSKKLSVAEINRINGKKALEIFKAKMAEQEKENQEKQKDAS